jgi:hypothetical protein
MEVCYWALLFMPLVILHHLLNVFVQLANKRGFTTKKKKKKVDTTAAERCSNSNLLTVKRETVTMFWLFKKNWCNKGTEKGGRIKN